MSFKKLSVLLLVASVMVVGAARADYIGDSDVYLFVDAAPYPADTPEWTAWWNQTSSDIFGGTFQNMQSGDLGTPGALEFTPSDEIASDQVSGTSWLWWLVWVPTSTIDEVTSSHHVFNGYASFDWNGAEQEAYNGPITWTDFTDQGQGVLGAFGYGLLGGDAAANSALASAIWASQSYARGEVSWLSSPIHSQSLQVNLPVPEPSTLMLLGLGVAGMAMRRFRKVF